MALKKRQFKANEIPIFDEAVIYKRGEYWQMRMWLAKEKKYARFSLKTRSESTAIDKAKFRYHEVMALQLANKTYYSKTTKQGVEEYLKQRALDVEVGLIVKGRYGTIKTHLGHWLDFIGRDTRLKELHRTDCENYLHSRTKTKKTLVVSQTTIANEQSTINAMLAWLYKRNETYIQAFDFKPLKRIDRGDEALRRATFDDEEIGQIRVNLQDYVAQARRNIDENGNLSRVIVGYYLLVSIISGMRRGEQQQLEWRDIEFLDKNIAGEDEEEVYSLVKITVRPETTKVRKTRRFVVNDREYFDELYKLQFKQYTDAKKQGKDLPAFANTLIFSLNGTSTLTPRAIGYLFDKMVEDAEIQDTASRDLVPYSFRHYFITNMINRGASPTQVAETCGTSTAQIERTYYHTTEAKMITNALPQFEYRNGLLYPKSKANSIKPLPA